MYGPEFVDGKCHGLASPQVRVEALQHDCLPNARDPHRTFLCSNALCRGFLSCETQSMSGLWTRKVFHRNCTPRHLFVPTDCMQYSQVKSSAWPLEDLFSSSQYFFFVVDERIVLVRERAPDQYVPKGTTQTASFPRVASQFLGHVTGLSLSMMKIVCR